MTIPSIPTSHIVLDEQGRPWISGTKTKVIEIVCDQMAYGWGAEEMHRQHPQLSLAQIHAALSYYYDHQPAMDAEIQASLVRADEGRAGANVSGQQLTRADLEKRLRERRKSA